MSFSTSPNKIDDNSEVENEEVYGVGHFLWEIVKIGILAFIIIIPVRTFLFQPFSVQGSSMEPNFHNREYLIVGEFGYKETHIRIGDINLFHSIPFRTLHRGDAVVFRPPNISGQYFIKRVVGLPGEMIEIENDRVSIRNEQSPGGFFLDESEYLSPTVRTEGKQKIQLADDEYYLLGDNRSASRDSRFFGPVSKSLITGKVLLRAWPFDRFDIF